jgi:hypothetical protein
MSVEPAATVDSTMISAATTVERVPVNMTWGVSATKCRVCRGSKVTIGSAAMIVRTTVPVSASELTGIAVEPGRSVEPGSGADEDTAREPLRSVVSIRSTSIRIIVIISVSAGRSRSDGYANSADSDTYLNHRSVGRIRRHQ